MLLIAACAAQPGSQERAGDEAAIRAQLAAMEAAWNERDAAALAALYTADGDAILLLNPQRMAGQNAIRGAAEAGSFFPLAGTPDRRISLDVEGIRFISSDVAIADATARFLAGEPAQTRPTYVMVRRDGTWRIAALRVLPAEQLIGPADAETGDADRAAIARVLAAEDEAFSSRNVDAVMAVYAPDVVMLPAHEPPIRGKDALRPWFQKLFSQPDFVADEAVSDELHIAGNWAVERFLLRSKATGQTVGKGVHLYRRQPDGSWQIVWDTWSGDVPPPEAR
jgi:uncharacterized protein (TIGR02246 family)